MNIFQIFPIFLKTFIFGLILFFMGSGFQSFGILDDQESMNLQVSQYLAPASQLMEDTLIDEYISYKFDVSQEHLSPEDGYLFENIDERTFSDVLVEFYIHSEVDGFVSFIKFLGLTGMISEEESEEEDEIRKLLLGQAAPGIFLSEYLSRILPSQTIDREVFLKKAGTSRKSASEIVDLTEGDFQKALALLSQKPIVLSSESLEDVSSSFLLHQIDHLKLNRFVDACHVIGFRRNSKNRILYGDSREPLSPSQQNAYIAVMDYLFSSNIEEILKEENDRFHLVLPDKMDKTKIEIALSDAAAQAGLKVLILVPSEIEDEEIFQ
jgi:hypothetical protein